MVAYSDLERGRYFKAREQRRLEAAGAEIGERLVGPGQRLVSDLRDYAYFQPRDAMLLEDMLIDLGHRISGISSRMSDAELLISEAEADLAILDVNLAGQET